MQSDARGDDQMAGQIREFNLTTRDIEMLEVLTIKVRMLSLEQVARTWWSGTKQAISNAQKRLQILEAHGFLDCILVFSHPEIELNSPLVTWRIGEKPADFGPVSYQLKKRWPGVHVKTLVVIATERCARQFGGHGGRRPKRAEMTHDLHVASVYLKFREARPDEAERWVSEDEYDARRERQKGDKLPDAMIRNPDFFYAIEFGGAYEKKKLEAFHHWCAANNIRYEIW